MLIRGWVSATGLIALVACSLLHSHAWGQDGDDVETSHDLPEAEAVNDDGDAVGESVGRSTWQLQPLLYAGAFGAIALPSAQAGVLVDVDTGVEATDPSGIHELRLDVRFLNDPLTLATFNFPEDGDVSTAGRLLQTTRELSPSLRLRSDWSDVVRTTARVILSERWAEARANRSRELGGGVDLRAGARGFDRGPSAEVRAGGSVVRYPNYRASDRSIDNGGYRFGAQLAYSFGRPAEVSAGYTLSHTSYVDARYDRVDANGNLARADESKSYLRHAIAARIVVRTPNLLRASLQWESLRTDASNYTRAIAGVSAGGETEQRVIRDYFDSWRHNLTLRGQLDSDERIYGSLSLELWKRVFDTYQARDADNVWLDETRHDEGFTGTAELGVRVLRWSDGRELAASVHVLHDARRSNMRREVSFATTFAVTRVLAGLEFRY